MTGVIKKLTDKGFGFIAIEGQEKDLFFHSKGLVGVSYDELREGDNVSFDVEDSPKGKNAVNVQRMGATGAAAMDDMSVGSSMMDEAAV